MSRIDLQAVHVEFPIYNVNARSLKKSFIHLATGGSVMTDANDHLVVSALKDINLTIEHGDRVGLIGHNGAGKSTFLRLVSGIYEPSRGDIKIEGHISPILDLMHGMETEFTGYENIILRGTFLGNSRKQINEQIENIAEFSGLGDYLSMPVRTYSSGMMVRLAFAISVSINPEILVIDEVFGAGDANFMERAREKMMSLLTRASIVIMANHSDAIIREFCNKVALFEGGQLKYYGTVEEGFNIYHGKIG